MTNLERFEIELGDMSSKIDHDIKIVYLMEADLDFNSEYTKENLVWIYQATLSFLNSLANNPKAMREYKTDDLTISSFSENIQNRIEQLEQSIRKMKIEQKNKSDFFMLFSD